MTVEILYQEQLQFGDEENPKFIARCLPEARFVYTFIGDRPYFADNTPDLIYMGGMTEAGQSRAIRALTPYRDRLRTLIDGGTHILLTSTAQNLLGRYIDDGETREEALGLYDFYVERRLMKRYTGYVLGAWDETPILGFKSQFDTTFPGRDVKPFIRMKRGIGMNRDCDFEGIHDHNLFATSCLGPFLVVNPLFARAFLSSAAGRDVTLPQEELMLECFRDRQREFEDPARKIDR